MTRRKNPFAVFFDYAWKYIWPVLIEGAIIGLGFLFVYFNLHHKINEWLGSTFWWIGSWFKGINKYFWAIELGEWAVGFGENSFIIEFLLAVPRVLALLVGFLLALVAQGLVNILAAVVGFVILAVLTVVFYVIVFGIIYVLPAASTLFAVGITIYLRKSQGVEYPIVEGILFGIWDVLIAIGGLVVYYVFIPL